jgi:hypothetical protein
MMYSTSVFESLIKGISAWPTQRRRLKSAKVTTFKELCNGRGRITQVSHRDRKRLLARATSRALFAGGTVLRSSAHDFEPYFLRTIAILRSVSRTMLRRSNTGREASMPAYWVAAALSAS